MLSRAGRRKTSGQEQNESQSHEYYAGNKKRRGDLGLRFGLLFNRSFQPMEEKPNLLLIRRTSLLENAYEKHRENCHSDIYKRRISGKCVCQPLFVQSAL